MLDTPRMLLDRSSANTRSRQDLAAPREGGRDDETVVDGNAAAPHTTLPESADVGEVNVQDMLALPEGHREGTGRFEFIEKIGFGGFGEVWKAKDAQLGRTVAVKLLRPRWGREPRFVQQLRQEARVASQLVHPAIVAVYDLGMLEDGFPFIVMEFVDGLPWHTFFGTGSGVAPDPQVAFSALLQLVEGLAFGHLREVLHRDIKPSNVLVSMEQLSPQEACRVRIVDWGLACLVEDPTQVSSSTLRAPVGTPAYLAPEVLAGAAVTLSADVYAVGVMMHELLWGHRPMAPGEVEPDERMLIGDADLAAICRDCLRVDPCNRIPNAFSLLERLREWWHGWQRREDVAAVLRHVDDLAHQAANARMRGERSRAVAAALRETILPSAPESQKLPLWNAEDALQRAESDLYRIESDRMAALLGALAIAPRAPAVRSRLADMHHRLHVAAIESGDSAAAARHLAALTTFDDGTWSAYIRGVCSISVQCDVPGARVEVRHLTHIRRRITVTPRVRWAGQAGETTDDLPIGRYEVRVSAAGHHPAVVCVSLGRNERWCNSMPGTGEAHPIRLLRHEELSPDEAYVAAGPHVTGAIDPTGEALPIRTVFTDGFVIRKTCVTVAEYIAFLNHLVHAGEMAEALDRAPQQRGAADDVPLYLFGQRADGTFYARPDSDGDAVFDDHPVTLVRPRDAMAYAQWLSAQTGQAWRLPFEYEWEKAARSADGRRYPFGDYIDASWVRCLEHHAPNTRLAMARVTDHPEDCSPLGVLQMAGNVFEMTASPHTMSGPRVCESGRWQEESAAAEAKRVLRGGAWGRDISRCLATHRTVLADHRTPLVGFRLVRDITDVPGE